MAPATIPTEEPLRAIAGDTWRWDRTEADYTPAAGWTLKVSFLGAGKLVVTGAANTAGTGWECTATAANTSQLPAGNYVWTRWVEQGAERYTLATGVVDVQPDPATGNAGDRLSWAARTLAVIEAFLGGSLEDGILEHQIHGRAVKFHDPEFLTRLRTQLQQEIRLERNKGRFHPMKVVFSRG